MSNKRKTVEQQLFTMIYKLIQKKTSQIFRQPVDAVALPDYYQKIKNPIDISKIISKMKTKQYKQAKQVKNDFKLLIANCKQYNVRMDILRLADKFDKSIQTQWTNFQKQCIKQHLDQHKQLEITSQVLKGFDLIQEKYNRKPQMLQNILGQLEQPRKQTGQFKILPPIPAELIQNDKQNDELPPHLTYKPLEFSALTSAQRSQKFHFQIDPQYLALQFQIASKKKLDKYRKILNDKLQWIDNKIFKKCSQNKHYQKMATVQYLIKYIQNKNLINHLQLRNIQMYVKMAAYWIQEYPQLLSFYMKNKFIDTCKAIKRTIIRVLRYKKQPTRSTKIQVDLNQALEHQIPSAQNISLDQNGLEYLPQQQLKSYDNQIKSFKRLLGKDQSETIKKWTKITIKCESGEWIVSDFNSQSVKQRGKPRVAINRNEQTEASKNILKQQQRLQQKKQDELFLSTFKAGNSIQLINTFRDKLQFDWDEVFISKMPQQIKFNAQNLISC